jgi:hypothetical protein
MSRMTTSNHTTPNANSNANLNTTLHTRLVELSAEPAGFSASEITGFAPETVRKAAEALVKAERIVRSKVSPRRVRYFANDSVADAFKARPVRRNTPVARAGTRFKAGWSDDEPAIITPKTKIYVAPLLPRNVYKTATYPQF